MKKLLALVLAFILCCGAATALASSIDLSTMTDEELRQLYSDIEAELAARAESVFQAGDTLLEGTLGDYYIALTDIRRAVSSGDTPCVILTYLFTNNSDSAQMFLMSIDQTVRQNGALCETATHTIPGVDGIKDFLGVESGETIEVQVAYELHDVESPIEIALKELFNWRSDAPTLVGTFAIPD